MDRVFDLAALRAERAASAAPYLEFLGVPSMSAGLYELPAGGEDRQRPHGEDEVYCVLAGRATWEAGGRRTPVGPGAVVFVSAGDAHRFVDVEQDLTLLVVFAPPEDAAG
jgi:mannose-6-phosphate isomerase-like protein (cupin superfamily)